MITNKTEAIEKLKEGTILLKKCAEKLRNDKEVVITAVSKYGTALEYASKKLRNDKEVVMTAVSNDESALDFASEELKRDEDILALVS